jgi:hypothetical protein
VYNDETFHINFFRILPPPAPPPFSQVSRMSDVYHLTVLTHFPTSTCFNAT